MLGNEHKNLSVLEKRMFLVSLIMRYILKKKTVYKEIIWSWLPHHNHTHSLMFFLTALFGLLFSTCTGELLKYNNLKTQHQNNIIYYSSLCICVSAGGHLLVTLGGPADVGSA